MRANVANGIPFVLFDQIRNIRISVLLNEINPSTSLGVNYNKKWNLKSKKLSVVCWWFDARVTPVLIPNTEVKPGSGDGTSNGRVASRQHTVLNFLNFYFGVKPGWGDDSRKAKVARRQNLVFNFV